MGAQENAARPAGTWGRAGGDPPTPSCRGTVFWTHGGRRGRKRSRSGSIWVDPPCTSRRSGQIQAQHKRSIRPETRAQENEARPAEVWARAGGIPPHPAAAGPFSGRAGAGGAGNDPAATPCGWTPPARAEDPDRYGPNISVAFGQKRAHKKTRRVRRELGRVQGGSPRTQLPRGRFLDAREPEGPETAPQRPHVGGPPVHEPKIRTDTSHR